ncbi:hypothetical protein GCM10011445_39660 [Pseudocitrobacter faecalis]|nr:hypothetical protein GCM10011445_39660 [Pseudocitrobacter faecalis]
MRGVKFGTFFSLSLRERAGARGPIVRGVKFGAFFSLSLEGEGTDYARC